MGSAAERRSGKAPVRDATVATEVMAPFLRCLRALGPNIERRAIDEGIAILAEHGIEVRTLAEPAVRLPNRALIALLHNGLAITGDPAFALRAAASVQRGEYGLFEYLSATAPTLGAAISLSARYLGLLHDGAEVELRIKGNEAQWRHRVREGLANPPAANEYVVAAYFGSAQRFLGFSAPPLEVWFQHAPTAHAAECERVFGCKVRFRREVNAIVFPKLALDLPLVAADPVLHETLRQFADLTLARTMRKRPLSMRVQRLVREHISSDARLGVIAKALRMSERTLRRRLLDENTTHSELVDSVRRELASEWLRESDATVSEVAYKLGFAHRPAFHRAFVRWFGVSPSELRGGKGGGVFYEFYSSQK